jgi:Na+/H+ antiporter NhaD/arsenite permease-like protein
MGFAFYAAGAIFVATYVLISAQKVGRFHVDRPAAAMLGAALMIAFGVVGPLQAIQSIDLNVILLLLGMMLLVAGLDACGFFDHISLLIARRARTQWEFLWTLMVATAVLSALVLNDAIALLMTPIVVRACRGMALDPVPFLVGEGIAVNVGSVATEVGNPQNAFIGIHSGIPFLEYALFMVPITAACLAISIGVVRLAFRHRLAGAITSRPPGDSLVPIHRRGLAFTLAVLAVAVVAFVASAPVWLPAIALVGGSVVLFGLPLVNRGASARGVLGKVDWSILLFFIGLFVVIAGVESSGLRAWIQAGFTALTGGASGGVVWLSGLTALLSNLVSNVPAVLLLAQVVQGAPGPSQRTLWLTLAASSTLAGNATILGAAANIIIVQAASRQGVNISFRDWFRAGFPATVATLVLATALLAGLP